MNDYMTTGPVPSCEDCAQLGAPDYYEKAKKECRAFRHQLVRVFGQPPSLARFVIKGFPHDLGTYYEVCVVYNPNDKTESDFAYKVVAETPENWDEEAEKELGITP